MKTETKADIKELNRLEFLKIQKIHREFNGKICKQSKLFILENFINYYLNRHSKFISLLDAIAFLELFTYLQIHIDNNTINLKIYLKPDYIKYINKQAPTFSISIKNYNTKVYIDDCNLECINVLYNVLKESFICDLPKNVKTKINTLNPKKSGY